MHNSSFRASTKGGRLSEGGVHRWREKLGPAEIAVVQDCCGDLMDRLGYARAKTGLAPARPRPWLTLPYAVFRGDARQPRPDGQPARLHPATAAARHPAGGGPRPPRRAAGRNRRWSAPAPRRARTVGCQSSSALALAMSGWRCIGSSSGSGRCTIFDREPVSASTFSASCTDGELAGVAEVDRPGHRRRGSPSAAGTPRSGRRRSRRSASGCRRRRS